MWYLLISNKTTTLSELGRLLYSCRSEAWSLVVRNATILSYYNDITIINVYVCGGGMFGCLKLAAELMKRWSSRPRISSPAYHQSGHSRAQSGPYSWSPYPRRRRAPFVRPPSCTQAGWVPIRSQSQNHARCMLEHARVPPGKQKWRLNSRGVSSSSSS